MWRAVAPIVLASPVAWGATYLVAHDVVTKPALLSLLASVVAGLAAYAMILTLLERSLLVRRRSDAAHPGALAAADPDYRGHAVTMNRLGDGSASASTWWSGSSATN